MALVTFIHLVENPAALRGVLCPHQRGRLGSRARGVTAHPAAPEATSLGTSSRRNFFRVS